MMRAMWCCLVALLGVCLACSLIAITGQSTSPKLMWGTSPLTPASLQSPVDTWVDVPDTNVTVELLNEVVVLISYDVSVSHATAIEPEDFQVKELSELSFRVAVDGSPYRQSATTLDDREPVVAVASGYLVLEIPRGRHDVVLQWRKRGTHVVTWAVTSNILDGFADSAAYDEIETVLEINGLRYRETGSYGIVEGSKKSTVQLQGSVMMKLIPGEYSAVLYWKSLLGSSRPCVNPWSNNPKIIAPTLVSGSEDNTVEILGVSISDTDGEMALDYEVTVMVL
ncbi:hypothetical protein BBP00_00000091 [Phytophthora kernoviae]|uniref:Uncharacterized protein n=1 Tax=Phytophthora kernoviae TaxID=325452 RepID=A0A3F2S452_9STRA|nr:hypothetical protein BBP00_00000091 [Phytophthora kernoviae]